MFFLFSHSRSISFFGGAILLCSLDLGIRAQDISDGSRLRSVHDMVVVQEGLNSAIFVSDNISHGIYYAQRNPDQKGPIDFADFELIAKLPQPSGLAYRDGSLFVTDPAMNAVLKIDVDRGDTHAERVALASPLNQPKHIAFSETGVMAVDSDKSIQYFSPKGDVTSSKGLPDVNRISFDGRSLIVLDQEKLGDFTTINLQPSSYAQTDIQFSFEKPFAEDVRNQLPIIRDFAFYRGVYYIAGNTDIFVLSRSQLHSAGGAQSLSISMPPELAHIDRIAVSDRTIFIADSKRQRVWTIPRPVPIVVDFPNAGAGSPKDQLRIIELMENKYLLTQTILSAQPYKTINELVRDYLFNGLERFPSQPDSVTLASLGQLVCRLNKWSCVEEKTGDGIEVIKQQGSIGTRNEIIIPNLQIKAYTLKKDIETASGVSDFSGFLRELQFVPLVGNHVLTPGQIIKVAPNQYNEPQVSGECAAVLLSEMTSSPASFPNEIFLTPEQFSSQIGLVDGEAYLQKMGVEKIVASFDNVKYERARAAISKSQACLKEFMNDPFIYVVDRVLLADGANYRFIDAKGKELFVNPKLFSSARVIGEMDPTKQWQWTVRNRLNLGYAGFRFSQFEQSSKPEITYLRTGFPSITQQAQQVTLLVNSEEALNTIKELNDLASKYGASYYAILGQDQIFKSKENSAQLEAAGPPLPFTLDDAKEERKRLRQLIHFPDSLSKQDLFDLKIGIVEIPTTIETNHQCFFTATGDWAWGDPQTVPDSDVVPGSVKDSTIVNGPDSEHGTHVAALIGARSILTGLTPTVRLVKIDTGKFISEVKNNVNEVRLFNLSSVPPGSRDVYKTLINQIAQGIAGGSNLLFVVAAGNERRNFSDGGEVPLPVIWLKDLPNNAIIVASATCTERPNLLPDSNFSKRYVQLLTPAENVFSATKGNTYAPASGTSQAAPQVTAVAALLRRKNLSAPWIKAVLIYTADWREDLKESVWGGMLNAQAAYDAANSEKNRVLFSIDGQPDFLTPPKRPSSIKIRAGAIIDDPNRPIDAADQTGEDLEIPFTHVLRMQRVLSGTNRGRFRIVYQDNGEMKMLLNAQIIEGGVPCLVLTGADGKPLVSDKCSSFPMVNKTDALIPVEQIVDYIRRVPFGSDERQVTFPVPQ